MWSLYVYHYLVQFVWEGTRGSGFTSDIAIDEISIRNGGCSQSNKTDLIGSCA